jgi:hypothetical protein
VLLAVRGVVPWCLLSASKDKADEDEEEVVDAKE